MTEDRFIKKNINVWERFESLIKTPSKTIKIHQRDQDFLAELIQLYNRTSAHLSYARTNYPDSEVCSYLNSLVSQGHNIIYTVPKTRLSVISNFYRRDLPDIIIRNRSYILASTAIFLIAAIYSWLVTALNPDNMALFLPEYFKISPDAEAGAASWNHTIVSSSIISNNVLVSLKAFAYGLTLGLGTTYVLLINGLLLGSVGSFFTVQGNALVFWSLVLPHGIMELIAIFISGGAGLMVGMSIVRPGIYSRRDALIINIREALKLMGMVVPMLVVAGITEGFLTPSSLPPVFKILFGIASGVLIIIYICLPLYKSGIPNSTSQTEIHGTD